MKTWKIIDWDKPDGLHPAYDVSLDCDHCGTEAMLPVCSRVIGAKGMGVLFDGERTSWDMPKRIKCRKCGKEYERP